MLALRALIKPIAPTSIRVSIQPFSITIPTGATSATATISAVTLANSRTYPAGFSVSGNVNPAKFAPRLELTNTTTVTAYRNTSDGSETVTVSGFVVEYVSGVISLMQRGTITQTGSGSATASITSADTTLTEMGWLGSTTTYTTDNKPGPFMAQLKQDSATQISLNRGTTTDNCTLGYEVATYSSTYMQKVSPFNKTVGVNRNYDFHEYDYGAFGRYSDQDFMVTYAGQKPNDTDTNYQNDFCAVAAHVGAGMILERGQFSGNATNETGLNFMIWKPGILKRRFLTNWGGILDTASSGTLALPSSVLTANKTFSCYLGQKTSSYTKSSASPANVFCRGIYDGTSGINFNRGSTSGLNNVGVGVYEFV